MSCSSDSFYMHYFLTAKNLRREVDDLTLPVAVRIEKITDAMQNLLMARDESAEIEYMIDEIFVGYFQKLAELTG